MNNTETEKTNDVELTGEQAEQVVGGKSNGVPMYRLRDPMILSKEEQQELLR